MRSERVRNGDVIEEEELRMVKEYELHIKGMVENLDEAELRLRGLQAELDRRRADIQILDDALLEKLN